MLTHLRHYFHTQVKEIVEQHEERSYKLWHRGEVIIFILYIVRLAAVALMFYKDNFKYDQYDHFAGFALQYSQLYNEYFCLLLIGWILLALVGKKVFFFTHVNTLSFQIIYNICVIHAEIYYKHLKSDDQIRQIETKRGEENRRKIARWSPESISSWIPEQMLNSISLLWAKYDVWHKLDCLDKPNFMLESMPLFPRISLKTRIKLIIFLHIIDFGIFVFMVTILAITAIGITFYLVLFAQIYSWWRFPVILLDLIVSFFLVTSFVQCGLLFTLMASYCSLVYIRHFTELCQTLHTIRRKVHLGYRIRRLLAWSLNHVMHEHSTIVYYIVYTNRDVWGNALLLFVLISIPVNAFMVSLILMNTMTTFEVILMIFVIVVHASIGAIPMISVAYTIRVNYSMTKYIIPVQSALGRDRLGIKLKLEDIFGRMSRGRKYGLTIGPMSAITFSFLFELLLSYVVIFIFVLEKKHQLSIHYK